MELGKRNSREKTQKSPVIKKAEEQSKDPQLKLYVYGSRQSDQFYLTEGRSQTRRPFCLSELEQFTFEDEQGEDKKQRIIPNPLFRAQIYKIACGGLHTVLLTTDGQAYTFGCNDEGALGRKGEECIPIKVELEDPVDLISAGDNHTLFANSINGAVYFTGNYNFKRGQRMTDSIFEPIKFFTSDIDVRNKDKLIQKLASGANHSIIMVDGKIFCRGQPEAYTIGRRINQRRKTKSSLTFDAVGVTHVVDVWCGGYHSVVKRKKGKEFVYSAWGSNGKGQLGINSYQHQPFPVQIQKLRGKDIVCMSAGTDFSIFLTREGEILSCGNNQNGNLGLGQDFTYEEHLSDLSQAELKDRKREEKRQKQQQDINAEQIANNDQNKDQQEIQKKLQSNLVISGGQKSELVQEQPVSEKKQGEQQQAMDEEKKEKEKVEQEQRRKALEEKMYVRSLRRVVFEEPPAEQISNIQCGSNFTFAWNSQNLYSWGFAMNYVLLNGSQDDDEASPFKVKDKIINNQIIYNVAAGTQHVVYTAYQRKQPQAPQGQASTQKVQTKKRIPKIMLDPRVRDKQSLSRHKLVRRRAQKPKK